MVELKTILQLVTQYKNIDSSLENCKRLAL